MSVSTTSNKRNIIEFAARLDAARQRVDNKLALFCKKLALDLYTLIVMDTPVDTGRARASWNVALDEPSDAVPETIPAEDRKEREREKKAGQAVGVHALFSEFATNAPKPSTIEDIDGKRKIFITSNLEYIAALENGHSQQSPHGMVAVNVAAMQTHIEVAAREIQQ